MVQQKVVHDGLFWEDHGEDIKETMLYTNMINQPARMAMQHYRNTANVLG